MNAFALRYLRPLVCVPLLCQVLTVAAVPGQDAEDDPPGAYRATTPHPGAIETLMLEYINRCRANPSEDALRALSSREVPDSVDREMFRSEMFQEQPAPPLVFDLSLLKAARWHCYYQIHNGQGHDEVAGAKGYTGATPSDRVRRAGFPGGASENVFVGINNPWYCHLGYIVDWGEGPGGMQPQRGHRRNILDRNVRLAGIGAVPYESELKFGCTHNFAGSQQRWVGGVVINDANRNGFYDMGEGIGNVALSTGESQMTSWASGAYALPIPTREATLTVELNGKAFAAVLPDGEDNVKFDVYTSDIARYERAAQLLQRIRTLPDTPANRERMLIALLDLHFATQNSLVEKSLLAEVQQLVEPVQTQLQEDMEAVRQAIAAGGTDGDQQTVRAAQRKYSKTKASDWFTDATVCHEMKTNLDRLSAQLQAGTPISQSAGQRALERQIQAYSRIKAPEWKRVGYALGRETAELLKTSG